LAEISFDIYLRAFLYLTYALSAEIMELLGWLIQIKILYLRNKVKIYFIEFNSSTNAVFTILYTFLKILS